MFRFIRVAVVVSCIFPLLSVPAFAAPARASVSDNEKISSDPSSDRAIALFKQGKYEEAIAVFNQLLGKFPKGGPGYMGRALSESKLGRHDAAVADAEKALEYSVSSSDKTIKNWVVSTAASIYNDRGVYYAQRERREFAKAVSDYSRALELNPERLDAYWNRSDSWIQLGKYQEAIADLDRCLGKLPSDTHEALGLAEQGRAYLKLDNPAKARANLVRLLELDPRLRMHYSGEHALEFYDVEKRRARMREEINAAKQTESTGALLEAFRSYQSARSRPLFLIKLEGNRNSVDQTAEDVELAKQSDDGLLRLYPKLPDDPGLPEEARRFFVQADASVKQERPEEAAKLFRKGLAIAPWWPQGYYNLAMLVAGKQQYDDAIANMKRYITLAPNAADAREAQDKIYEWELGSSSNKELRASALAGVWTFVFSSKPLRVKHTWEMVVVGENQLEMNPIKMNTNMRDIGEQALSREQSGYYSLTLKGRQLQGVAHQPGGKPDIPVTADLALDNNEMTMNWTDKGKVSSFVWKREK
jgi:tetratricopeptide (TPR) repeat protein